MRILFILLLFFTFTANATSFGELKDGPILIAHAGGAYQGIRYLNSKEAMLNSIKNGFKYIELDLLETSDHDLVAAHDWATFNQITIGRKEGENTILSLNECQNRKILKSQTVLTSQEISEIMLNNPSLYLVTDKIQNVDLLVEKFKAFKNRIIMEVFTTKKYKEALDKGILYPAFCVWDSESKYALIDQYNIKMITLSANGIDNKIEWYKKHPSVIALAFSTQGDKKANDIESIKNLYPYISAWYTDNLIPSNL